jgi:anti-anti-sigma factor
MADRTGKPELSVSALQHDRDDPCAVVSLTGRAGIADCRWLRLLLELQAEQGKGRLVVDLSRVSSMDWWVALILNWIGRVVSRRGGELVLVSPQPAVARLLDAVAARGAVAGDDYNGVGGIPACLRVVRPRGARDPRLPRRTAARAATPPDI